MALCTSALKYPDLCTKIQCFCRILINLTVLQEKVSWGFSVLWHCPCVVCNVQDMLSMHWKLLDWPLYNLDFTQWPGHDTPSSAPQKMWVRLRCQDCNGSSSRPWVLYRGTSLAVLSMGCLLRCWWRAIFNSCYFFSQNMLHLNLLHTKDFFCLRV